MGMVKSKDDGLSNETYNPYSRPPKLFRRAVSLNSKGNRILCHDELAFHLFAAKRWRKRR